MRKILSLLLLSAATMMAWTSAYAQTDAEYDAALAAITDGGVYRIKTNVEGTAFYVTTSGTLTSNANDAGLFTITKPADGTWKATGFRIDSGTERFTNPNLVNDKANLNQNFYAHSTGDRNGWERQVLFLKDGKYAIRSCNTVPGESSWADAGRTFWTYNVAEAVPTPCYSYDPAYVWEFDGPLTTINVTYNLVENSTQVSTITVKQEANSAVNVPKSLTSISFNGSWHEIFYYNYTTDGTIGDTDCVITVIREVKAGTVRAFSDLRNNKAYNIGCERGAFLTADGKMVSTALDAATNEKPLGKFAIIDYKNNYYLYSVDEGKLVKNNGTLISNLFTEGFSAEDALKMEAKAEPLFLFYFTINGTNNGLNTNGNAPLGYVINTWMTADPGNQYYMVAVDDFDPTAILADLKEFYEPTHFVQYVVKAGGKTLFTSEPQPTYVGAHYTALPEAFKRSYYTYSDVDVTVADVETTTIEVEATWGGPFEISPDFDNAHWYNMVMRSKWLVTSDKKDGDGAYQTQNKDKVGSIGLGDPAYQWAFVGDGYNGFQIFNKAEGAGNSFGYTTETATNGGIPTIMSNEEGIHAWYVVPNTNTSVPANSFCLGIYNTNLYINQYGGEGGSVKFWNSTGNLGDPGSAFTVFDVPTDFAEYVVEEVAPSLEATGYFTFNDEGKAFVGWDPAYKTSCTYEQFKSLKTKLDEAMKDATKFILPANGYYLLKNKYYGTYMGIDPSDANLYGNYKEEVVPQAKHIVKLTYEGLEAGNVRYSIGLMGAFVPEGIAQSTPVTAAEDNGKLTLVIPAVGYAAFMGNPEQQYSALHTRAAGDLVGWEPTADASQWTVENAVSINFTVSDAGYATAYLPFDAIPVPGTDLKVYTAEITPGSEGKVPGEYEFLTLNELTAEYIPAATPVIFKATPDTYVFWVDEEPTPDDDVLKILDIEVDGGQALVKEPVVIENNDLKGTFMPIDATGKYVLGVPEGEEIGFWPATAGTTIAAGKVYMELENDGEIKGFIFGSNDNGTGIKSIENAQATDNIIYNVAGQRLSKTMKGINIVNGKKILK